MDNEKKHPTLDYVAAKTAQQIITRTVGQEVKNHKKVEARDVDTLITKTLGVLQSQGVYAMALFLFSRSGKETEASKMKAEERIATEVLSWLWPLREPFKVLQNVQNGQKLITDRPFNQINQEKEEMLKTFADLTANLDTLLLVRDLYEQTLIYARYGAKAAEGR